MADDSNDNPGNVVVLHDDEVERKVLRLRLAGVSITAIGREVGLNSRAVLAALDRALPQINQDMRVRLFREDLARLDELLSGWWVQARNGNATATQLVLKLLERRAAMTGMDTPVAARIEVIQQGDQPTSNSTQQLLDQLNLIAAEREPGGLQIEVEAEPSPAA